MQYCAATRGFPRKERLVLLALALSSCRALSATIAVRLPSRPLKCNPSAMSGAGKKRGAASAGSGSSSKKQMGEKDLMRDLEGWWALDLARSDTMEAFLKKMGMGEIPILAAIKAEKEVLTLQHFEMTADGVKIRKRTRLGTSETEHTFGDEVKSESILGSRTSLVECEKGKLRITTQMPSKVGRMKQVDTRWVEMDGGERVMRQVIVLTSLEGGDDKTVDTNRYFTPSKPPEERDEEEGV